MVANEFLFVALFRKFHNFYRQDCWMLVSWQTRIYGWPHLHLSPGVILFTNKVGEIKMNSLLLLLFKSKD